MSVSGEEPVFNHAISRMNMCGTLSLCNVKLWPPYLRAWMQTEQPDNTFLTCGAEVRLSRAELKNGNETPNP